MQLLYRPKIIDEAAAASMTKKKIEKGNVPTRTKKDFTVE